MQPSNRAETALDRCRFRRSSADEVGSRPTPQARAGTAPDVAYQIVHDELMLDGNARLNLATFVTTWMAPQAAR